MIQPKSEREMKPAFVVVDIENDMTKAREGELLHIGMTFRNGFGEEIHHVYRTWEQWWVWIVKEAYFDKRFRTIWAHNGGGWDWTSLVSWLLKHPELYLTLSGTFGGLRNITISIKVDDSLTLLLCDSYLLFRCSLDTLGKQLLGEGKAESGGKLPHELYYADQDRYFAYLKQDCSLLLRSLEKALELIHNSLAKIGTLGPTAGNTAMRVFATGYLKMPISVPSIADDEAAPKERRLREFLRKGYRGGRCEVFNYGHFKGVKVFDVNSLYPAAMRDTLVPISDRGIWTIQLSKRLPAVYEIEYEQKRTDIPPVLIDYNAGSYQGKGVYFSPELQYLREIDPEAVITVKRGFIFQDAALLFRQFVDDCYKLRLAYPDSPISTLAKAMMNNLYGKFAQHSEREEIVTFSTWRDLMEEQLKSQNRRKEMEEKGCSEDWIQRFTPVLTPYGEPQHLTFVRNSFSPCNFEHVGISGMITSSARVMLHKAMMKVKGRLLYCDTDSLHIQGDLDSEMVGKELGQFKQEYPSPNALGSEGVYCGRKLYALRENINHKWTEKVRVKGVKVGSKMGGADIHFWHLCDILDGKEIDAIFYSPETLRNLWRNRTQPNKLLKRKRKLKRT